MMTLNGQCIKFIRMLTQNTQKFQKQIVHFYFVDLKVIE